MNIDLNIPDSWNKLSSKQLIRIASYIFEDVKGKQFEYLVFFTLLALKWWQFRAFYKAIILVKNVPFKELKKHYSFIYEKTDRTVFITAIKSKVAILYAPADRISNLTIDEFAHAEDSLILFQKEKNVEYLYYLTAILYREKTPDGKRKPFDKTELTERFQAIKTADFNTIMAIALTYKGCRSHLYTKFKTVFPSKTKTKTNNPTSSGFGKLILNESGKKFGTYNETATTNVLTFLSEFEDQLIKQEKTKK